MRHLPTITAALVLVLVPAGAAGKGGMLHSGTKALERCDRFDTHEEMGALLQGLAEPYSDIFRLFSAGSSVQGRNLYGVRISAEPHLETVEPEIRVIGSIHGNECIGARVVLDIVEWLTSGYGDDPFVSDLVDNAEIVLVPLVNPDGYSAVPATRTNANKVDLNYNLHFAWIDVGPSPFSEPETRAIRDLSQSNSFVIGLSYHTRYDYVNSAWNYNPHHPPDADLIWEMGEAYAGDSGYRVTFGWDWYNIQGDINDWSLGTQGTFDWTIELRSDTDDEWEIHSAGLEGLFAYAFKGVVGRITDLATGQPLHARIAVAPEGSPVFTDPDVGDYHRILLPGTYALTASAQGYRPVTVTGVVVEEAEPTRVDMALEPEVSGADLFAFAVNGMTLPEAIDTPSYDTETYPNSTMVWDALGPPDGVFYSLTPEGSLTLDMGASTPVKDREGLDLRVVSGTESDEPVSVYGAKSQDGPFDLLGEGRGTFEVDLAYGGFEQIRFVRLVDTGDAELTDPFAGYDVDAVVRIGDSLPPPDTDTSTDTGEGATDTGISDTDTDTDADTDTDSTADSESEYTVGRDTALASDTEVLGESDGERDSETGSGPEPDAGSDTEGDTADSHGLRAISFGCQMGGRAGRFALFHLVKLLF